MRIDGSSAFVAGGASGLGEATVRTLHAAGATVTIGDLNAERGAALAAELGDGARFCLTDVTDGGSVQAAVDVAAADRAACGSPSAAPGSAGPSGSPGATAPTIRRRSSG